MLSVDNLCMDLSIRSYMDEAGYIPVAFLCNYENVAYYGAEYPLILDAIDAIESLDLDRTNEVVRPKEKWEMVCDAAVSFDCSL